MMDYCPSLERPTGFSSLMHGSNILFLAHLLLTSSAAVAVCAFVLQVKVYKVLILLENCLLRMLSQLQSEQKMALLLDVAMPRMNQPDAEKELEVLHLNLFAELVGY